MPRQYWWLVARDDDGIPILIFGSAESEQDARYRGLETLAGRDFTIRQFPTRDQARASQMLKGVRLERTKDLSKAMQRLRHKTGRRRR